MVTQWKVIQEQQNDQLINLSRVIYRMKSSIQNDYIGYASI